MSYTLIIAAKNYSSWSMRAWTLMRHLGVPFEEIPVDIYVPGARDEVRALGGPAGLVPVLKDGGRSVWETMAIYEYLHERHGGVWPEDEGQRAMARSIAMEMSAGMHALRAAMPVNTRARSRPADITPEVQADIARILAIWEGCLAESGGPFLFGALSGADLIYAPVATRFRTYDYGLAGAAEAYAARLLEQPVIAEWLELGAREDSHMPRFEKTAEG